MTFGGKDVQRPFKRHPGQREGTEDADQFRQLALQRILPLAPTTGQESSGSHIASPGEKRDQQKGARKQDRHQAGEQSAGGGAHQPNRAQFDPVNLIRLEAGLDQVERIDARGAKMEPTSPEQRERTDPALVPTAASPLVQPPLDRRQRCGSNQFAGRRLGRSNPTDNGLQPGETGERRAKSPEGHASNLAIRRLSAMPATSSAAASGNRTNRPRRVLSSTLNSCGFTSRR